LPTSERNPPDSFLSIIVTVRNEAAHLSQLLESLVGQESPFEVVLVDAFSEDRTPQIAREFEAKHPGLLRFFQARGKRGAGRNFGAKLAKGTYLVFTDGDCVVDSGWLASMRAGLKRSSVVAGKTITIGNPAYANLERVELYVGGMDLTHPSCNLAYERQLFERLGGFDDRFVTAEDIDLNLRAVRAGASIQYCPEAVVYHNTRMNLTRFLIQAFWNGYGRKQLTEKHGQLWSRYRYKRMFDTQKTLLAYVRLVAALVGYFTRLATVSGTKERIRPDIAERPVTEGATKG
jgi:glycosyltransferase involved in cell wall biosynthesis